MTRAQLNKNLKSNALTLMKESILFSGLNSTQLGSILDHTCLVKLAENEVLFVQGQEAKEIHLLESGQIKLARVSIEGHEKIIELIFPGQSFAEAILFSRKHQYPVTATAVKGSVVLSIERDAYSSLLHESTDACFSVMEQMSYRMHQRVAEIDRLTLHNATFRVIVYLLEQIPEEKLGEQQVRLNSPKHMIASRLSVTPETLSRTFAKLAKEGFMDIKDKTLFIHDVDRLKNYILNNG